MEKPPTLEPRGGAESVGVCAGDSIIRSHVRRSLHVLYVYIYIHIYMIYICIYIYIYTCMYYSFMGIGYVKVCRDRSSLFGVFLVYIYMYISPPQVLPVHMYI